MIEILEYTLPKNLVNELDQIVDQLIDKMSSENILKNAFVPIEGCQIRCKRKELPEQLISEIMAQAKIYSEQFVVNPENPKYVIDDIWLIEQKEKDFTPLHSHRGEISGVVHLRVPECINRNNAPQGCLQFVHGRGNYRQHGLQPKSLHYVVPKPGILYVFPAWLYHTVYPFYGPGVRRAISFNLIFENSQFKQCSV